MRILVCLGVLLLVLAVPSQADEFKKKKGQTSPGQVVIKPTPNPEPDSLLGLLLMARRCSLSH